MNLFNDADETDGGADVDVVLIGAQNESFRHCDVQVHEPGQRARRRRHLRTHALSHLHFRRGAI